MIDEKQVRADTPNCEKITHFNNAGASLNPRIVSDVIYDHLALEQKIGSYEAQNQEAERLEQFYTNFSKLLNCRPQEVAYIENATRAWDMIAYSIPFKKGDKVITCHAEYASNFIALLQLKKKYDLELIIAPNDEMEQIDLENFKTLIDERVKLVCITHIPTSNGLINPVKEVGKILGDSKAYYLLDACQSVGQLEIDVKAIGCDFLTGTGRKYLRGPRGTGFLYIKESLIEKIEPVFLDLHSAEWVANNHYQVRSDAKRFENWECYVAGKLGLSEAVSYCNRIGIKNIEKRTIELASYLREKLSKVESVKIHDKGRNQSGIVTFSCSVDNSLLYEELLKSKFNTSITYQKFGRLDFSEDSISSRLRASVHYYNTFDEIDKFSEKVLAIIQSELK